jgi:hypothetical protein
MTKRGNGKAAAATRPLGGADQHQDSRKARAKILELGSRRDLMKTNMIGAKMTDCICFPEYTQSFIFYC